jgi:hypothetical protein
MNSNIKKITKENCNSKHEEMKGMGMYYCPVCEEPLKEQNPILITITTKANVIYKEAV